MIDWVNFIMAVLTILFGLFGFLVPKVTAEALDLRPTFSTMGLSELRASVGGAFVFAGAAALLLDHPMCFVMIGVTYLGAAAGRVVSLIYDSPPREKVFIYGGIEAVMAAWLLGANLPQI